MGPVAAAVLEPALPSAHPAFVFQLLEGHIKAQHPRHLELDLVKQGNPHRRITSFAGQAHITLPDLVRELHGHQDSLEQIQEHLRSSSDGLPAALERIKDAYSGHNHSVYGTLKETVSNADQVKEKIETFNERIDEGLKNAMHFAAIVKKQNDFPGNELPDEMLENSGAVVANLLRAKKLGQGIMTRDAEELLKVAKEQRLKFSEAFHPTRVVAMTRLLAGWDTVVRSANESQQRKGELHLFL